MTKVEDAKQRVLRLLDQETEPKRMSAVQAMEVLQELRDDIAMRLEALREENPE